MPREVSDHSLKQINRAYLSNLKEDELLGLSIKMLHDLKEAREQLNQNSSNSSKPPSSRPQWEKTSSAGPERSSSDSEDKTTDALAAPDKSIVTTDENHEEVTAPTHPEPQEVKKAAVRRKPGKQVGAPGYGRTWCPPISVTINHQATHCAACEAALGEAATHVSYTAFDSVDIEWGTPECPGVSVIVTRHMLYDSICRCGHSTRARPYQHEADSNYPEVVLGEWRLIGPKLASLVVHLRFRWRLSVRRTQELLQELLGIPLSVGALHQCTEEAAAGAAPLEEKLVEELLAESGTDLAALHADETGWKEGNKLLWLWVFVTSLTVYFKIGRRSRETFNNVIGSAFEGWLMSDGYNVYRHYAKRLRCWAHLIRKARGLVESLDSEGGAFGKLTLDLMHYLETAIYAWREGGGVPGVTTDEIRTRYQQELAEFRRRCVDYSLSAHEKTAALAKEFLNDWDAIFRVIDHPWLPLTNNEAERSLRHWVILRYISHGTKTPTGSQAFALLASITATCRLRGASSLAYLADVITAARSGLTLPSLPLAVGV